tara:strand:- start:255 stop:482 length:228 start_codon:yes stop_codon:yes gene_type:complete
MAKIIDVDFKKKKVNFTFNQEDPNFEKVKRESLRIIEARFLETMDFITILTEDDIQYRKYCMTVLSGILSNLSQR